MAFLYSGFVIFVLCLSTNHGVNVEWRSSSLNRCRTNDTILGSCFQTRTVQCVKSSSGQPIPDYYCSNVSPKPSPYIKCDSRQCAGRCVVSFWSTWQPCDQACLRSFSYRTRSILWKDDHSVSCPLLLEKKKCQHCLQNSVTLHSWKVGKWGTCRAFKNIALYSLSTNQSRLHPAGPNVCGRFIKLGKTTRKVKCVDANGVELRARRCLNSKDKDGRITQRPDRSKICQFPCDCHMSSWSSWSGCPRDCSRMEEIRSRDVLFAPQLGGKPCGKLMEKRACLLRDCPRYEWYTTSWGKCVSGENNNCGDGFEQRLVFCIKSNSVKNMTDVQPVGDAKCDVALRPVARQLCQKPCPMDCVVSAWLAWEPCSASCGKRGVKRRRRRVLEAAKYGGAVCPSLVEMARCESMPCAFWHTKPWSECWATGTCGRGMKYRMVYCVGPDLVWLRDRACSKVPRPLPTSNCTVPCPYDCVVSEWSHWTECSKSCGKDGGVQTRKRNILAHPNSLRVPCPPADELVETRKCNVGSLCESEERFMWKSGAWSTCKTRVNGTCGKLRGTRKRQVHCGNDLKDFANETLCLDMLKLRPVEFEDCDVPCPKDCVVSKWGEWSRCNASCSVRGVEVSKRYVLQYSELGGKPCPLKATNGVEVRKRPCTMDKMCFTYAWSISSWQGCKLLPHSKSTPPTCGSGYQTRNVSCLRSDKTLVPTSLCFKSNLEPPPDLVRECWRPCHDYCVRSSWSKWSECPGKCSRGLALRFRRRQVVNLSPARGGFSTTCPVLSAIDFTQTEDCPKIPCNSYKWFAGSFGSCFPDNRGINCGFGRKERAVLCQETSSLTFVSESLCDISTKPSSWQRCSVECTHDCLVSSWGEWDQKCSNTCGNSLQKRERTVLKQPRGLGRSCPSLVETRLCEESSCSLFKWSVDMWETCKLNSRKGVCGNGSQTRNVTCSPDPKRDWICLQRSSKPATVQTCRLSCPGDCVMSNWNEWSVCQRAKHGCVKMRRRQKIRNEHPTSRIKCSSYTTSETRNCTCPSRGKIVTSDWSTCQLNRTLGPSCGKGVQSRSVNCVDINGVVVSGEHCNLFNSTVLSRDCKIPCPVDCIVGNWGPWSACTKRCGVDGKMTRSRRVMKAEQDGGRRCPDISQYKPCNGRPCYKYSLHQGRWSKCYVDGQGCGYGKQSRESKCMRSDGAVVSLHYCFGKSNKSFGDDMMILQDVLNNMSLLSLTSTQNCEEPCPGDCVMSVWSDWSECGRNCFADSRKSYQTRSRVVISNPNTGGKACSSELSQTRTCATVLKRTPCIGAEWKTGAWRKNGTRSVWCETLSGVKVTGACAVQNQPKDTLSCNPACSDPNAICKDGRCICKGNYEMFLKECIPIRGCLHDKHCIHDHSICKRGWCVCDTNFVWNNTSSSCAAVRKVPKPHTTRATTMKNVKDTVFTPESTISSSKEPSLSMPTEVSKSTEKLGTGSLTGSSKISTADVERLTSTTPSLSEDDPVDREALKKEKTFFQENWKWIGIGAGALLLFIFLAVVILCYTRRQSKSQSNKTKARRDAIELVGITLTSDDYVSLKPAQV